MKGIIIITLTISYLLLLTACSPTKYISNSVKKNVLIRPPFQAAHVGISIFDAGSARYLYNYQADKYFVPASNTKIFTLYAGLKLLKDSLQGLRYEETADTFFIYPTADPTLLHPDFKKQPVIERLQKITKPVVLVNTNWQENALGSGWAWDDYNGSYMPERSPLPVYGNVVKWIQITQKNTRPELEDSMQTFIFSEPEVNWKVRFKEDPVNKIFSVQRRRDDNYFEISQGRESYREQSVPFVTNGILSAIELLKDTIQNEIIVQSKMRTVTPAIISSQLTDSLLKMMMYRSDNFFAEQVLLMASDEKLGVMNDAKIIDTLLKSDLQELPQQPTWVDGSGLSRYNLFTPQSFVWILNKMRNEFGMERLKTIFPGGGQGTLANYYKNDSGYIFAKTGTLSGQVALSGFLITRKNRLLIFSCLVNNHKSSTAEIRKSVESFLSGIRRKL